MDGAMTMGNWSIQQSRDLYNVGVWSGGYFDVNEKGHVIARPRRDPSSPSVDLHALALEIRQGGLDFPILVRFMDVLRDRVDILNDAFHKAMEADSYTGKYTAVYPIKVNQNQKILREIVGHGGKRVGLEAGSKPELMAVLALSNADGGVIVCNGYKDREYVRLALIGQKLGHRVYIVVEKRTELDIVLAEAARLNIDPDIGVRVRLASIGAGKWQNTGGEKSKFGLSATQALDAVECLKAAGKLHCLKLLHCHLGSQIANINDIQRGMKECARYYAEFSSLGAQIETVDVGGGLGIDYEGTRSRSFCSMNYTVQEYARNVVHTLWEVCDAHDLPHPDIFTESGRAMTAHHAVLITNVIDYEKISEEDIPPAPSDDAPQILHDLWRDYEQLGVGQSTPIEAYHDASHRLTEAQSMYVHGILNLDHRAQVEGLYYAVCRKALATLQPSVKSHRQALDELNDKLADKYFCNISIFQSLPDVWALDQIFPILPLARLDERPTRRGVLEDVTCDSDGRIDNYVDGEGIEPNLPLHAVRAGEPYLLGIFLVGAYQEILGDMHNLFGDTNSVNVELTTDGYRVVEKRHGDVVDHVLKYVQYETSDLRRAYEEKIARANLSQDDRRQYLQELLAGLQGYTYLEERD